MDEREEKRRPGCPIDRRDFLNGVALTIGASLFPAEHLFGQDAGPDSSAEEYFLARGITQQDARYYPPSLSGMRGSHPGSFEAAHALRDGRSSADAADTGERYDLIVVGGGISGLAAAYFYRKTAGAKARILILDNHDDFGGHAKRNEFHAGDRLLLGYGGTQSIEAPGHYSKHSIELLKELGIDVHRFYQYFDQKLYSSMKLQVGIFFDRETFAEERLVVGPDHGDYINSFVPVESVAQMPIDPQARKDLVRLHVESIDYLPGLTPEERHQRLATVSYKNFLLQIAKVHPDVVKTYQTLPQDLYCVGIDAVSAMACRQMGYPGFKGMAIATRHHHPTEDEEEEGDEPYIFHFPDGNASIARLLVRSLVPGSAPGNTMEDIVTAKMDYTKLDQASSPVRIRLNSTAVHVKNVSVAEGPQAVEVTYSLSGKLHKVHGSASVLACYNCIVPYLCPEMSEAQKEALAYAVKQPLVYVNVQLRNWTAFAKLGVSGIYAPNSYFTMTTLDFPVSMGSYKFPSKPDEPCVVHLLRTPCKPGLTAKQQFKAGRYELLSTPYEVFERNIHDQLNRMLAAGGFDSSRDIQAITVNRWPHGYAYEYNSLFEPQNRPPDQRPCVLGRKPFGRITIANSDSDGHAYTNIAIDQGYRAVQEVFAFSALEQKG
jgi:spermidine dehydrogenase